MKSTDMNYRSVSNCRHCSRSTSAGSLFLVYVQQVVGRRLTKPPVPRPPSPVPRPPSPVPRPASRRVASRRVASRRVASRRVASRRVASRRVPFRSHSFSFHSISFLSHSFHFRPIFPISWDGGGVVPSLLSSLTVGQSRAALSTSPTTPTSQRDQRLFKVSTLNLSRTRTQ